MRRQQTRLPRDVPDQASRPSRRDAPTARPLSVPHFSLDRVTPSTSRRAELAPGVAVFAAVAVASVSSEGLGIVLGALVGAAASAWAIWRRPEEWRSWLALTLAFLSLAGGRIAAGIFGSRAGLASGMSFVELGTFGFSIGAATCCVVWPEIRRSTFRSVATLIDIVMLVAATAVWGWAGFPPFGGATAPVLGRAADLLLPVIAACVAAPQLGLSRRSFTIALAGGAMCFLAAEVLASPELGINGVRASLVWVSQGAGFALLVASIAACPAAVETDALDDRRVSPPFPATGVLGIAALILGTLAAPRFGPPMPLLPVVLVSCLGLREVLRIVERRWATERLAASIGLEARLLALQSEIGPMTAPRVALKQSCALSVEVLKADAALAWLVEGDSLVLSAAAPERREQLLGRRLPVSDTDAIAARVFRRGSGEACNVLMPGVRSNSFLSTLLDAGSVLALPITHEVSSRGVLVLVRESGKTPFSSFDQQKAALVAGQAAASLRRYELYGELESRLSETMLVHRFVVQAIASRTVNDVGWIVLQSIRSQVPFERGVVYALDNGPFARLAPIAHFRPRHPGGAPVAESSSARLSVPLLYGDHATGYVELDRPDQKPFTSAENRLVVEIAQQAAVAIQTIRLRRESGQVEVYRELDRLKTELLSNVSHDLRGPLTNIKGYASSLVDEGVGLEPDEQMLYLRTIEEEADRLKDLLEHLLDLSRIDAGALQIDLQPVGLPRIVHEIMFALQRPGFQFRCEMPEDLKVAADSRRLRQVVANLLENAVKYSPEGGTVTVCALERQGEVEVAVTDQGVGIPRKHWDRIFRPYQRAESGKAADVAGNGLGLAICKGIVEAHGGRIWVESEPGIGSTFSFTVPRAPSLAGSEGLPGMGARG
jgi:signal transduction histidine kinase